MFWSSANTNLLLQTSLTATWTVVTCQLPGFDADNVMRVSYFSYHGHRHAQITVLLLCASVTLLNANMLQADN